MNDLTKLHANLVLASRFENIEVAERALVDLFDGGRKALQA